MNDRFSEHDPDDDTLRELLSDLKKLEPPPKTRQVIRQRVTSALASTARENSDKKTPLWRRTIAVPWPIAAACLALLFASWSWILAGDRSVAEVESQLVNTIAKQPHSPPVAVEQRQMTLERRETTTYLCGVGPIYKSTLYFSSEE